MADKEEIAQNNRIINAEIDETHKRIKYIVDLILAKYDAFLATQLTLIAKEKGVSVADLCLRHNDIHSNIQKIDGDIKFWVEIK